MPGKLYIYDDTTPEDRSQARGRMRHEPSMTVLGVTSKSHLIMALDVLVTGSLRFDRVLVQTHGSPGKISLGTGSIYDTSLRDDFTGRKYHTLFPFYTRIYFDGCNVADGSLGTDFLEMTGSIFLKLAGGEVFGWTNYGYGLPGWVPFIGGHTIHNTGGNLKKLFFRAGGIKFVPPPERDPFEGAGKPERGYKI